MHYYAIKHTSVVRQECCFHDASVSEFLLQQIVMGINRSE